MYVFEEWKTVDGERVKVDLPDKKGCAKYDYLKGHSVDIQLFSSYDGGPPTMVIPEFDMFIRDFRTCPKRVRLQTFLSDLFQTNLILS